MSSQLSIAISPCPNDTFIFEHFLHTSALAKEKILDVSFLDIEQLNQGALAGKWDMVKVSCAILQQIEDQYTLLSVGAAIGKGVGPLLIARHPKPIPAYKCIAIPGKHTTAYKLLRFAFPFLQDQHIQEMEFSEIEEAIQHEKVDAGVIIHESRFTYQDKQLICIADLGKYWEETTKLPVPLGCVVLKKNKSTPYKERIEQLLQISLRQAWNKLPFLSDFVCSHAHEIDKNVMQKHIQLYVNELSFFLGEEGKQAIQKLKNI